MELMIKVYDDNLAPKDGVAASHRKQVEPMMELVRDQKEKLAKEVERWCQERGV
jgi:indoleamine 2,3-dioxygenase